METTLQIIAQLLVAVNIVSRLTADAFYYLKVHCTCQICIGNVAFSLERVLWRPSHHRDIGSRARPQLRVDGSLVNQHPQCVQRPRTAAG